VLLYWAVWFVPRNVLPDSAMGFRPTCAPLTSGIPGDAENCDSAILCKLYTGEGSKLSSPKSTSFHSDSPRLSICRMEACSYFGFHALFDEQVSDLSQHLIDPRRDFPLRAQTSGIFMDSRSTARRALIAVVGDQ
jgi:hypothetical protein